MIIGYARVSTKEQETRAQQDALQKVCDVIHTEKRSGGNMNRPILRKILKELQPTDVIVVYKIDRIARSLKDLLIILEKIEAAGAEFKSLTEVIDTTSPAGRMILQILGAFAEFERELIRERTNAGIAAAQERGIKFGRPYGMSPEDEAEAMRLWFSGNVTKTYLAKQYGVHMSSIKRAIARHKAAIQPELFSQ